MPLRENDLQPKFYIANLQIQSRGRKKDIFILARTHRMYVHVPLLEGNRNQNKELK